jgi:protein TonB
VRPTDGFGVATLVSIALISCTTRPTEVTHPVVMTEVRPNPAHPIQLGEQYYPAESRLLGEQGTCRVKITVTAEGEIRDVTLTKSTGYPRLDQACVDGFRGNHMLPATRNGKPVTTTKEVPINWTLTAPPSPSP